MTLVSLLLLLQIAHAGEPAAAPVAPPPLTAQVISVYDGDTMTLETGDRVRLRSVNTPEIKPYEEFAAEARDAAEAFVAGHQVKLSYGSAVRDHYGRLIANIEVDGEDLALHLVSRGLAHVFIVAPADADLSALLAAQARARAEGLGIWSDARYKGELHITSFHANGRGDERENVNAEYLRVCNVASTPLDLSSYRITDISGTAWQLPAVTIPPGYTFEIRSGVGEHQADPSAALKVFLGSEWPIWNNDRDRATLLDAEGRVVDSREHAPKSRQN